MVAVMNVFFQMYCEVFENACYSNQHIAVIVMIYQCALMLCIIRLPHVLFCALHMGGHCCHAFLNFLLIRLVRKKRLLLLFACKVATIQLVVAVWLGSGQ